MKKVIPIFIFCTILFSLTAFAQNDSEPWTPDQLMAPGDLATIINDSTATKPLIIDIGPAGLIKGAVNIGAANDKENLKNLKELISKEKKDRQIVIYCGCCPFQKCPNIRPAFSLLNSMKFTNHKLLNLSTNLKTDWINYGYPMNH
jgi:hypothetical protein